MPVTSFLCSRGYDALREIEMKSGSDPESEPLLLCGLAAEAAADFRSFTRMSQYKRGSFIFSAGEATQGVFAVRAGRIKLSASSNRGRTLTFRIAWPGELLGLSSTIAGAPYELTAQTLAPSQVDFMERADFLRFLENHPGSCFRVLEMLSREVTNACEQIGFFGGALPASGRLAILLLGWCAESGVETEKGIRLALPLTAKEIGHMIGTSRETIARLMGKLREDQIVERSGGVLVVRDKAALEGLARPGCNSRSDHDRHAVRPRPGLSR
jgi:CRP/FNR family cyclic AMP-dependent transcriptional regulator